MCTSSVCTRSKLAADVTSSLVDAGPDIPEGSADAELSYVAPNTWPAADTLPKFRDTMMEYMDSVSQLAEKCDLPHCKF